MIGLVEVLGPANYAPEQMIAVPSPGGVSPVHREVGPPIGDAATGDLLIAFNNSWPGHREEVPHSAVDGDDGAINNSWPGHREVVPHSFVDAGNETSACNNMLDITNTVEELDMDVDEVMVENINIAVSNINYIQNNVGINQAVASNSANIAVEATMQVAEARH